MELYKLIVSSVSILALSSVIGCSSSSETTTTTNVPTVPSNVNAVNVASASNGATVTSSFSGDESFTNDEDTTTTNFWKGGADGDFVKIAFDKSYSVSEIAIYTNNTSSVVSGGGAATTSGLRAQLSNDDLTYDEVAIALGLKSVVSCYSSSSGGGKIVCTLSPNVSAQYIKVLVTSDFSTTEVYEIEVKGI